MIGQAQYARSSHRPETLIPEVEVVVEVPRGSFLKRGVSGSIDLVSPLPCPFNYGHVPGLLGGDDDLLDALVLGERLPFGAGVRVRAYGAIRFLDRGIVDDKLVCAATAPDAAQKQALLRFFSFYAMCKAGLNMVRGRPGATANLGWVDAGAALSAARELHGSTRAPVPY